MTQLSPTDVPYRHRMNPMLAYGRLLMAIAVGLSMTLVLYRFMYQNWYQSMIGAGIPISREQFSRHVMEEVGVVYGDDGIFVDFLGLLLDVLPTPYLFIPLVVCGLVTLALVLRHRDWSIPVDLIGI